MRIGRREPRYTEAELAAMHEHAACVHCGGIHAVSCPRVRSMEFDAEGKLRRVEFWPRWDERRVVYPEDLPPPPVEDNEDE